MSFLLVDLIGGREIKHTEVKLMNKYHSDFHLVISIWLVAPLLGFPSAPVWIIGDIQVCGLSNG